jgi:Histidine kinase
VSDATLAASLRRRFSRRALIIATLILPLLVLLGGMGLATPIWGASPQTQATRLFENVVVAIFVFVAVLLTDELVDRGAPPLPAYALAIVAAALVGALLAWKIYPLFGLRFNYPGLPDPAQKPVFAVFHPGSIAAGAVLVGGLATFVHAGRRTALAARRRQHGAEQARALAQRRMLESQLQALQARVEPMFLFGTLERIRQLYRADPAAAGAMMEDLIVYLRAALPHLRESTSTVAQELTLASAWLDIVGRTARGWRFDATVAATARRARLPALLLLPLIQHAVASVGEAPVQLRLDVRVDAAALHIELATSTDAFAAGVEAEPLLEQLGSRLQALYRTGSRLRCNRRDNGEPGSQARVELPSEVAAEDEPITPEAGRWSTP